MTQTTIRGGRRMSTAVCYLDPARRRPNLKIQANALTECLLFDGKRCVGVRYTLGGLQYEARADREAVVSAGSINSPQLLELSGIGRSEVLKAAGIEVRHELRGVGEMVRGHDTQSSIMSPQPSRNTRCRNRRVGRRDCGGT